MQAITCMSRSGAPSVASAPHPTPAPTRSARRSRSRAGDGRARIRSQMRLALAMLVLIVGSAAAEQSMKGWEIYSWPDKACAADPKHPGHDAVCFALLPGTNRMKSAPEIKKAPLSLAELVKRLGTLTR